MLQRDERTVLEVVDAGGGRLDTRHLDFEYYARSCRLLEPNILRVLRDLERRGLVEAVPIEGGTGPGWDLTPEGRLALSALPGGSDDETPVES